MGRKRSVHHSVALMEAQPHFPDHGSNSQLDKFGQFSPNVAAMEVQPYAQDMMANFQLDKFGHCSPNVGSLEFDPYAQDMRAKSHLDKFGQFRMKYLDKLNGSGEGDTFLVQISCFGTPFCEVSKYCKPKQVQDEFHWLLDSFNLWDLLQ